MITKEIALDHIQEKYPYEHASLHHLDYWAYPQVFPSTSGPFGGVGGQAFTTFTIEAWADGNIACLFCKGKVIKVTDKWQGPQSVRI